MSLKLYTVVRHDLDPGAQAAQSAHALAALALNHPGPFKRWDNQTIVLLKTTNKITIDRLVESAEDGHFTYATFREPALLWFGEWDCAHNIMTAVSFAPSWTVQNVLLKDLPLALSDTKKKRSWFRR